MNGLHFFRKQLWKIFIILIIAFFLPVNGFAAPQFGLGISITETGRVIHCPVKLNPNLRLEGSLGLYTYERENTNTGDTDWITLKFGAYIVQNVYEKTDIYYGGKLIYQENDTNGLNEDGYGIAPTFGFEYYLTNHISVGGEAEVYFMLIDNDSGDAKEYGTDSRVILRYYF